MTGKAMRHGDGGWLLRSSVVVLAVFLQGMVLWQFVGIEAVAGSRALFVGGVVMLLHVLVASTYRSTAPRRVLPPLLSLTAAVLVLALSLVRHHPTEYGIWKVQGFMLFAFMPSVLIIWNLTGRHHAIRGLLAWMLALSFTPLLLPLRVLNNLGTGPLRWLLTSIDVDLIGIGRILGIGSLLAFVMATGGRRLRSLLLTLGGLTLLVAQVFVGERGPLLALIVGLAVFGWEHGRGSRRGGARRYLAIIMLATVVAAGAVTFLFLERAQSSHQEMRIEIASQGWDSFVEAPLTGVGVGRFTYEGGMLGERQFFHNIVGEIAVEMGVVGMVVFALYFWAANRRPGTPLGNVTARRNWEAAVSLLAYTATAAFFSGDLTTNYHVWVSQALLFAARHQPDEGV